MGVKYPSKKDLGVGKRFVSVCEKIFTGLSRQRIADELKLENESRIRLYEGGSLIEPNVLAKLRARGVSIDWLLFGEGEMLASPSLRTHMPDERLIALTEVFGSLLNVMQSYQLDAMKGDITPEQFGDIMKGAVSGIKRAEGKHSLSRSNSLVG